MLQVGTARGRPSHLQFTRKSSASAHDALRRRIKFWRACPMRASSRFITHRSHTSCHHQSVTPLSSARVGLFSVFTFFRTFFKPPTRMIFIKTETLQQKTALWSPPILFFLTPRRGKPPNDRGRALQPTAGNHFLIVVDNQTTLRATRMRVARLL